MKYLATGSGGCGTLSVAKAFNHAGFVAEHEFAFNFSGSWPDLTTERNSQIEMEASWMAAWHLPKLKELGVYIIHLVRHPFRVVESIYDAGQFYKPGLGGYNLVAHNAMQRIHDYDNPWSKTACFVVEINRMIEPYADLRWKIEDGVPELMAHLGIEWDTSLDRKWHASNKVHPKLERGMIADELWDGLEELRVRYGY